MTIKNIYAFISTHTATLIVSLLTIALAVCDTQGQSMTEVYESGHLDLTAGETITPGNNWQRLNDDWDAKAYGKLVGRTKSMAVGADGSIYVCSKSAYRIDKLDSRGQLVWSFGSEGGRHGQFRYRPTLHGILDGRVLLITEHSGRLTLVDTDGHLVKTIQLDYMPLMLEPMRDDIVAVVGHVPWRDGQVRYVVSLLDVDTEEEEIIDSRLVDGSSIGTSITTKDGRQVMIGARDLSATLIAATPDRRELVVGHNGEDFVAVYSIDGAQLHTCSLNYSRRKTTRQEDEEYTESMRKALKEHGVAEDDLDTIDLSANTPTYLPYYYNLVVDGDSNLLLFLFTDAGEPERFRVYSPAPSCRFIGEVALDTDGMGVNLNARLGNLQFVGNAVYALGWRTSDSGGPLRILRKRF